MGPDDYIETVLTCKGDYYDPEFPRHLERFSESLRQLIKTEKQRIIIKKVEPWNSVRVTFNIPKEAAQRLRRLAEQGNAALQEIGVLAVQIEGDRVISLTIAGKNNERTELVLRTSEGPQAAPGMIIEGAAAGSPTKAMFGPGGLADTLGLTVPSASPGPDIFRPPGSVAASPSPLPGQVQQTPFMPDRNGPAVPGPSYQPRPGMITGQDITSPGFSQSPPGLSPQFTSPVMGQSPPPGPFQSQTPPPPYPGLSMNNLSKAAFNKALNQAAPGLLVNLLQHEGGGAQNNGQPQKMPPPEGATPQKRRRRRQKNPENKTNNGGDKSSKAPSRQSKILPADKEAFIMHLDDIMQDVVGDEEAAERDSPKPSIASESPFVSSVSHSYSNSPVDSPASSIHTRASTDSMMENFVAPPKTEPDQRISSPMDTSAHSVKVENHVEDKRAEAEPVTDTESAAGVTRIKRDSEHDEHYHPAPANCIINPYTGQLEPMEAMSDSDLCDSDRRRHDSGPNRHSPRKSLSPIRSTESHSPGASVDKASGVSADSRLTEAHESSNSSSSPHPALAEARHSPAGARSSPVPSPSSQSTVKNTNFLPRSPGQHPGPVRVSEHLVNTHRLSNPGIVNSSTLWRPASTVSQTSIVRPGPPSSLSQQLSYQQGCRPSLAGFPSHPAQSLMQPEADPVDPHLRPDQPSVTRAQYSMAQPRPDFTQVRPAMGQPRLPMGQPRFDTSQPRPDMVHRPEMGHPRPDMGHVRPELSSRLPVNQTQDLVLPAQRPEVSRPVVTPAGAAVTVTSVNSAPIPPTAAHTTRPAPDPAQDHSGDKTEQGLLWKPADTAESGPQIVTQDKTTPVSTAPRSPRAIPIDTRPTDVNGPKRAASPMVNHIGESNSSELKTPVSADSCNKPFVDKLANVVHTRNMMMMDNSVTVNYSMDASNSGHRDSSSSSSSSGNSALTKLGSKPEDGAVNCDKSVPKPDADSRTLRGLTRAESTSPARVGDNGAPGLVSQTLHKPEDAPSSSPRSTPAPVSDAPGAAVLPVNGPVYSPGSARQSASPRSPRGEAPSGALSIRQSPEKSSQASTTPVQTPTSLPPAVEKPEASKITQRPVKRGAKLSDICAKLAVQNDAKLGGKTTTQKSETSDKRAKSPGVNQSSKDDRANSPRSKPAPDLAFFSSPLHRLTAPIFPFNLTQSVKKVVGPIPSSDKPIKLKPSSPRSGSPRAVKDTSPPVIPSSGVSTPRPPPNHDTPRPVVSTSKPDMPVVQSSALSCGSKPNDEAHNSGSFSSAYSIASITGQTNRVQDAPDGRKATYDRKNTSNKTSNVHVNAQAGVKACSPGNSVVSVVVENAEERSDEPTCPAGLLDHAYVQRSVVNEPLDLAKLNRTGQPRRAGYDNGEVNCGEHIETPLNLTSPKTDVHKHVNGPKEPNGPSPDAKTDLSRHTIHEGGIQEDLDEKLEKRNLRGVNKRKIEEETILELPSKRKRRLTDESASSGKTNSIDYLSDDEGRDDLLSDRKKTSGMDRRSTRHTSRSNSRGSELTEESAVHEDHVKTRSSARVEYRRNSDESLDGTAKKLAEKTTNRLDPDPTRATRPLRNSPVREIPDKRATRSSKPKDGLAPGQDSSGFPQPLALPATGPAAPAPASATTPAPTAVGGVVTGSSTSKRRRFSRDQPR